jgi:hypothetical protein
MKRIVLCFDGTWNKPAEGVGTQWYDQYIGGAIGTGLELNIIQVTRRPLRENKSPAFSA